MPMIHLEFARLERQLKDQTQFMRQFFLTRTTQAEEEKAQIQALLDELRTFQDRPGIEEGVHPSPEVEEEARSQSEVKVATNEARLEALTDEKEAMQREMQNAFELAATEAFKTAVSPSILRNMVRIEDKEYSFVELVNRVVLDSDDMVIGRVVDLIKIAYQPEGLLIKPLFSVRTDHGLTEHIAVPCDQVARALVKFDDIILKCRLSRLMTLPSYLKLNVKKPRVRTESAIEKTTAAYCQRPDENGKPPLVVRGVLFEEVKKLGLDCSSSRFSQILTEMETRGLIERRRESGVVELRMDRKFWMLRKHDFHRAGTVRSATKLYVRDRISWLVYPLAVSLAKDRSFAQVLDLSPKEIQEICEVGPLYAELIHEGVQDDDQLVILSWYVRGGEGVKPTIAMGNETEMKIFQRIMWLVDSLASELAFERKFVDVIDLSSEGIRAICGVDSKTAARIYELLRDEGQWVPQEVE